MVKDRQERVREAGSGQRPEVVREKQEVMRDRQEAGRDRKRQVRDRKWGRGAD